jgi:hypothetical protein
VAVAGYRSSRMTWLRLRRDVREVAERGMEGISFQGSVFRFQEEVGVNP